MTSIAFKIISTITISTFLCSCASTTQIVSNPPGANIYINGEKTGKTPFSYTDTRIIGSDVRIKLTKPGFNDLTAAFARDEEADIGPIIGGVVALVPLLWAMKYKPEHSYEMISIVSEQAPATIREPISFDQTPTKKSNKKKMK